ncbi:hypothetical protein [Streptomyces sp. RKAG337]|uniref:hypothetical protein n=1 Tax=Streptomyces sp. RKAG337 TaxID=2893404 RepID=UPI002033A7E6|nr:hypothetical protein [Streptomyces sp. RKAG337]MCM2430918.1 hypothetical protein [Streptomyces sp. RKAG337]
MNPEPRSAIERRRMAQLPPGIATRPRDARGYPISFVTALGPDGTPDFTELDGPRRAKAIIEHLCGLCGQPLPLIRAVIGGPQVVEHRLAMDPPMCVECAVFAATHAAAGCPFLLMPNARYRKDRATRPSSPLVAQERPQTMYLARTYAHNGVRLALPDGSEEVLAQCARWTGLQEIRAGELVDARHLLRK